MSFEEELAAVFRTLSPRRWDGGAGMSDPENLIAHSDPATSAGSSDSPPNIIWSGGVRTTPNPRGDNSPIPWEATPFADRALLIPAAAIAGSIVDMLKKNRRARAGDIVEAMKKKRRRVIDA